MERITEAQTRYLNDLIAPLPKPGSAMNDRRMERALSAAKKTYRDELDQARKAAAALYTGNWMEKQISELRGIAYEMPEQTPEFHAANAAYEAVEAKIKATAEATMADMFERADAIRAINLNELSKTEASALIDEIKNFHN